MKVAIMQPYFFPYIGYFQLIKNTDLFVLFDDVQYIRHGWVNRNRILKPEKDWQYILAPLEEHKQTTLIKDIQVQFGDDWKNRILRQIEHYKKKSPFYNETKSLLEDCFSFNDSSITKFNAYCLKKICDYIQVSINLKISSQENYDYTNVCDAGEWALRICEQVGASSYLNPIGGRELFSIDKFSQSNVQLSLLVSKDISYSQRRNEVREVGLSIIDVLMFNSPEQINHLMNQCEIQIVK